MLPFDDALHPFYILRSAAPYVTDAPLPAGAYLTSCSPPAHPLYLVRVDRGGKEGCLLVFWGKVGSATRHACLFKKDVLGCLCVGYKLKGRAAWGGRLLGL